MKKRSTEIPGNATTRAVLEGNSANGTFSGVLERSGDQDWIKVDLIAGHTYSFFLAYSETGTAAPGDAFINLLNSAGGVLTSDDDSGVSPNALMSFPVVTTGTYFINVIEIGGTTGEYSLYVTDSIIASIKLTSNNDDMFGSVAGTRILGGAGSDAISIGAAIDALGEQGNDIIFGNSSANKISGGIGEDTIDGLQGGDTLFGDAGNDVISGGEDGDLIRGGAGIDILNGDEGFDVIFGGPGKDFITGGSEGDVFEFLAASDSRRGVGRDVITDFLPGTDDLDLASIDAAIWLTTSSNSSEPASFTTEPGSFGSRSMQPTTSRSFRAT